MKAERNRRTEATIAEGNAASKKIVTDALSMQTELLAAAEARAKAIPHRVTPKPLNTINFSNRTRSSLCSCGISTR